MPGLQGVRRLVRGTNVRDGGRKGNGCLDVYQLTRGVESIGASGTSTNTLGLCAKICADPVVLGYLPRLALSVNR